MSHSKLLLFAVTCTVLHTFSLLSSSFVEEEHQTWYFVTVTFNLVIMVTVITSSVQEQMKETECQNKDKSQNWDQRQSSQSDSYTEIPDLKYHQIQERQLENDRNKLNNRKLNLTPELKQAMLALVTIVVVCRIARTWNQTGNKWLDIPDHGDWLDR